MFRKKSLLKNKKGFTLVELILVIVIIAILSISISITTAFATKTYVKLRTESQAISLANDILNGLKNELKNSRLAFIEYNKNTRLGSDMEFVNNIFFSKYDRRIFLDNTNYIVLCQNRNMEVVDTIKSKYYNGLVIKNLKYETAKNDIYSPERIYDSGYFIGDVHNIVLISFQIYTENKELIYQVENYNIEIDNMVLQIFNNEYDLPNLYPNYDWLKIACGEMINYIPEKSDFNNPLNLDADLNINLDTEYYNVLYYSLS